MRLLSFGHLRWSEPFWAMGLHASSLGLDSAFAVLCYILGLKDRKLPFGLAAAAGLSLIFPLLCHSTTSYPKLVAQCVAIGVGTIFGLSVFYKFCMLVPWTIAVTPRGIDIHMGIFRTFVAYDRMENIIVQTRPNGEGRVLNVSMPKRRVVIAISRSISAQELQKVIPTALWQESQEISIPRLIVILAQGLGKLSLARIPAEIRAGMSHFRSGDTLTCMGESLKSQCPSAADTDDRDCPDAELVAWTLRGNRSAYESLVRRYERSVHAVCFAVLRDGHGAQDAAQDAFMNAYAHLGSLRNQAHFSSWILTIARNGALAVLWSNRSHQRLEEAPEPVGLAEIDIDHAEVIDLIAQLPDHERAVVMLRYIDGHDVGVIARIRGCSVGTITKQLSRAHERLRKVIIKGERR